MGDWLSIVNLALTVVTVVFDFESYSLSSICTLVIVGRALALLLCTVCKVSFATDG